MLLRRLLNELFAPLPFLRVWAGISGLELAAYLKCENDMVKYSKVGVIPAS